MDVIEAIHGRRSIRRYRPDAVARALIEDLIWAAVQAPTPPVSGSSPWAFAVIEGRERLAALGEEAKAYAHAHQPAPGAWEWTVRPGFEVFWGAPAVVVIGARRAHPEAPLDCCRAGQNLMLAAHASGLGSCWVGSPLPWLRDESVARRLGLPEGFEPSVAITLGYPDERPAGQPRARPAITWCG